ncbi:hypothetical protein TELCIR_05010 [Teladorsagia circumcincta]|uniref:Rab-GAP TBC domain-containing protein n=1 Tax=Teladorsagia circumcincta TaxID=45464 RepID=A0A2G9URZ1_TELCI|nr:hypothetical protein TELCIR_05010 [Teladorsagia circumcincta]
MRCDNVKPVLCNQGESNILLGKDGDIVYSKNNVCVHDLGSSDETPANCKSECSTKAGFQSASDSPPDISVEMNGDVISVTAVQERPTALLTANLPIPQIGGNGEFGVPSINVIPHTPIDRNMFNNDMPQSRSQSSISTSGADEGSGNEEDVVSSSYDSSDHSDGDQGTVVDSLWSYRESLIDCTPEQFAYEHNLMLTETSKILHFHHGGLDKLAQLFEQWSAVKAKSVKNGSPSPLNDKHLLICQPTLGRNELDPEDGLYDMVTWDYWKSYKNRDGVVADSTTIRKAIFFASMEPGLRKEIWPFLLRIYPWQSTLEQRETIRNDLFLEYQNLRKKTQKKSSSSKQHWSTIENTILKDVVRTDRKNPYYSGEDNPNIETMK